MAREENGRKGRQDYGDPGAAEIPPGKRSCDDGRVHENGQGEIRLGRSLSSKFAVGTDHQLRCCAGFHQEKGCRHTCTCGECTRM